MYEWQSSVVGVFSDRIQTEITLKVASWLLMSWHLFDLKTGIYKHHNDLVWWVHIQSD